MDMSQYLEIFLEESKEHLQSMNETLLALESNPKELTLINEIFRIAHTLKGMSGTMGFTNIAHLTHEMENVLHQVRNSEIKITGKIIDLLFECFDQLESYIHHIEVNGGEGINFSEDLIQKLVKIKTNEDNTMGTSTSEMEKDTPGVTPGGTIEINQYVSNVIKNAYEDGLNIYSLKITLDSKCMLKSARAYIIFNTLEKLGEIIQAYPSIEDIEDEKFDDSFELIMITKYDKEFIVKELSQISEIDTIDIANVTEKHHLISSTTTENKEDSPEEVDESEERHTQEENKTKKTKGGKTVRVDIDRLDNLMNLVSELIIIKTRLEDIDDNNKRQNMNEAIEYLERITTSLHDAVMKVRMVPIERVFNRFPRMVRDLSKELKKDISLIMSGAETEVDRTVIDEIGDPLIHLIRNSIDHGIEGPEERLKAGKSKTGTVRLIAYPDGNSVVIEVEDDGKGIDIEKVKQKAISKGITTAQQAQLLDEKDIIQFLFAPGFSTADKISDISGRGVGLDVVKTKIESLGGIVEVNSKEGKGSKFIIRLPLTLAIIQALLVIVGSEKYAIPLNTIKEITTIPSNAIRKVQNNEVVLYRNTTLPILRIASLLDIPDANEEQEEHIVVIVKKGDKTAGLIVDELIGQQEIVIKSLGKFLTNIKAIAGATILGNGSVALIVDTNSFF